MLCEFCKDFDYDQLTSKEGYKHQANWRALCLSADGGCAICGLVKKMARGPEPWEVESPKWQEDQRLICKLLVGGSISWGHGEIQRCHLGICTNDDDEFASLIDGRVYESPLSQGCLEMMSGWLRRCRDEHESCPAQATDQRLPTRVIDVGSDNSDPRLVVSNGRSGRWAALSHCWGGLLPIKTEERTLEGFCEGIPLDNLTPTFRDAVLITRGLGIKYLWIDALCIIQGSEEDWSMESRKMDYVYQNAAFTIAAEASENSSNGIIESMFLRVPQSLLPHSKCHSSAKVLQGKIYFRINFDDYGGASRGPLSNRAWTMREEILSPRILRFAKHQVLWRCASAQWREWKPKDSRGLHLDFSSSLHNMTKRLPEPVPNWIMLPSEKSKRDVFMYWYMNVVNFYVGRKITYPSDKLVAIDGIVKVAQQYLSEIDYEAGLWLEDIHSGLAWSTPVSNATKYPEYIAPSWSWAQMDCSGNRPNQHFLYNAQFVESFTPLAKVVKISKRTMDESSAMVERLALEIQGECCGVCSCKVKEAFLDQRSTTSDIDYHYGRDRIADPVNEFIKQIGLEVLLTEPCLAETGRDHQEYIYLQLGRWEPSMLNPNSDKHHLKPVVVALILKRTGSKKDSRVYERVGRALIPTDPKFRIEWPTKALTIV